jgi:hypothetical protein
MKWKLFGNNYWEIVGDSRHKLATHEHEHSIYKRGHSDISKLHISPTFPTKRTSIYDTVAPTLSYTTKWEDHNHKFYQLCHVVYKKNVMIKTSNGAPYVFFWLPVIANRSPSSSSIWRWPGNHDSDIRCGFRLLLQFQIIKYFLLRKASDQ